MNFKIVSIFVWKYILNKNVRRSSIEVLLNWWGGRCGLGRAVEVIGSCRKEFYRGGSDREERFINLYGVLLRFCCILVRVCLDWSFIRGGVECFLEFIWVGMYLSYNLLEWSFFWFFREIRRDLRGIRFE